jgi:hypothetical protein
MTFAPPPIETSSPPAASMACFRADSMPSVNERERRAAPLLQRLSPVMREHEDRPVEGGIVAPSSAPGDRVPRAGAATEHVATHDGRADVVERLVDDLGAWIDLAAFEPLRPTPDVELERPLVKLGRVPLPADAPRSGCARRGSHPTTSRRWPGASPSCLPYEFLGLPAFIRDATPPQRWARSSGGTAVHRPCSAASVGAR